MMAEPIRTCLGCGSRFPKRRLRKFILDNGRIMRDSNGTGPGRSVYCCNNERCLHLFFRQRKRLSRAFRVQEDKIRFVLEDLE